MKPEQVEVPRFLPGTPEVRQDILDYYFEVQRFDRDSDASSMRCSVRASSLTRS